MSRPDHHPPAAGGPRRPAPGRHARPHLLVSVACALLALPAARAQHDHHPHTGHAPAPSSSAAGTAPAPAHAHHGMVADTRAPVHFPAMLRAHTLANMRDHLLALAEIQGALGQGAWDRASQIAEQRLGMSSLRAHGAHDVARFMPQGMQDAGTAMHRSASRFAVEAQNSSASGDARPALAALAAVTQACVACHAAYRFE